MPKKTKKITPSSAHHQHQPRRVSRSGRPRGPRRESPAEPRFVKVELYVEASSTKRVLESRSRYKVAIIGTNGRKVESLPVLVARVVDDPVEFRGRLPYGFVRRAALQRRKSGDGN